MKSIDQRLSAVPQLTPAWQSSHVTLKLQCNELQRHVCGIPSIDVTYRSLFHPSRGWQICRFNSGPRSSTPQSQPMHSDRGIVGAARIRAAWVTGEGCVRGVKEGFHSGAKLAQIGNWMKEEAWAGPGNTSTHPPMSGSHEIWWECQLNYVFLRYSHGYCCMLKQLSAVKIMYFQWLM